MKMKQQILFFNETCYQYKIEKWNDIIKEIHRILKHNSYAEIIEYNINIKKILIKNYNI